MTHRPTVRTAAQLGLALALASALPAGAQIIEEVGDRLLTCSYTEQCVETTECTFANFGHDAEIPRTMPGDAVLLLGTGPAEGTARIAAGTLVVSASDATGSYMLSNTPQGFAKLTVHFAEPLTSVTYHGSCSVME